MANRIDTTKQLTLKNMTTVLTKATRLSTTIPTTTTHRIEIMNSTFGGDYDATKEEDKDEEPMMYRRRYRGVAGVVAEWARKFVVAWSCSF